MDGFVEVLGMVLNGWLKREREIDRKVSVGIDFCCLGSRSRMRLDEM